LFLSFVPEARLRTSGGDSIVQRESGAASGQT
jgi:hypothetical protein